MLRKLRSVIFFCRLNHHLDFWLTQTLDDNDKVDHKKIADSRSFFDVAYKKLRYSWCEVPKALPVKTAASTFWGEMYCFHTKCRRFSASVKNDQSVWNDRSTTILNVKGRWSLKVNPRLEALKNNNRSSCGRPGAKIIMVDFSRKKTPAPPSTLNELVNIIPEFRIQ